MKLILLLLSGLSLLVSSCQAPKALLNGVTHIAGTGARLVTAPLR